MSLESYVNHYLQKCGNDINFTMKVFKNSAELALEEGDVDAFELEAEAYQHLEVIKSRKAV